MATKPISLSQDVTLSTADSVNSDTRKETSSLGYLNKNNLNQKDQNQESQKQDNLPYQLGGGLHHELVQLCLRGLERFVEVSAQATSARSCGIFIPQNYPDIQNAIDLELLVCCSLVPELIRYPKGKDEYPLVFHAAKTAEPLNAGQLTVSDLYLKPLTASGVAIIPFELIDPATTANFKTKNLSGALFSDTTKHGGFSHEDLRIFKQLTKEASQLIRAKLNTLVKDSDPFNTQVARLIAIFGEDGVATVEVLLTKSNFPDSTKLEEDFIKLVEQSIPPHFPIKLNNTGKITIAVDRMMSSYFLEKIREIGKNFGGLILELS